MCKESQRIASSFHLLNLFSDYEQQVELLQQREQLLVGQKNELEKDFGQKRARFMELFKQKEGNSPIFFLS